MGGGCDGAYGGECNEKYGGGYIGREWQVRCVCVSHNDDAIHSLLCMGLGMRQCITRAV